jgi:hypothetical protein
VVFSIERELGNDQRCLVDATRLERLAQRWPVTALAALDLGELTNELSDRGRWHPALLLLSNSRGAHPRGVFLV